MSLDVHGSDRARRIAVVDPGDRARDVLRRVIRRLGHMPEVFATLAEMKAACEATSHGHCTHYDMVWLACRGDLAATGELLGALRALTGTEVPVVFAASRTGRTALSLRHARAIDTVITPPPTSVALYGELRRIFKRRGFGVAMIEMTCGPYRFFPASSHVRIGDEVIELRPMEFDLALEFFRHADRVLSREWLHAMVWEGAVVESRALDTHVSRLRRKLRMPTADGWTLRAVPRVGYRLVAPAPATVTGDGIASAASTSFASEAGLSSGA